MMEQDNCQNVQRNPWSEVEASCNKELINLSYTDQVRVPDTDIVIRFSNRIFRQMPDARRRVYSSNEVVVPSAVKAGYGDTSAKGFEG